MFLPLRVSSAYSRSDLPKAGLPSNHPAACPSASRRLPSGVSGKSSLIWEGRGISQEGLEWGGGVNRGGYDAVDCVGGGRGGVAREV